MKFSSGGRISQQNFSAGFCFIFWAELGKNQGTGIEKLWSDHCFFHSPRSVQNYDVPAKTFQTQTPRKSRPTCGFRLPYPLHFVHGLLIIFFDFSLHCRGSEVAVVVVVVCKGKARETCQHHLDLKDERCCETVEGDGWWDYWHFRWEKTKKK